MAGEVQVVRKHRGPGFCPVQRRVRERRSSLNILTGEIGAETVHWLEGPCNSPVFGKERDLGVCSSCAKGWEVEGSQIIDPAYQHLRT